MVHHWDIGDMEFGAFMPRVLWSGMEGLIHLHAEAGYGLLGVSLEFGIIWKDNMFMVDG